LAKSGSAYYGVQGEPSTLEFDLAGLVGTSVDCKKRTSYVAGTSAVNVTISSITNGNVGDVVVFRSTSTGATVTFVDNDAAAGTSNRILTPATGNLVKTGSRWAVTAYRTATGWVLS
jgi:predicted amidohydrolase